MNIHDRLKKPYVTEDLVKKILEKRRLEEQRLFRNRKIEEKKQMVLKTTKSRVFKRFLRKLSIFFGIPILFVIAWISMAVFISVVFSLEPNTAFLITTVTFVITPMLGFFAYNLYKDSKEEIADENKKLMRDITGF